jgi:hypothetical protein
MIAQKIKLFPVRPMKVLSGCFSTREQLASGSPRAPPGAASSVWELAPEYRLEIGDLEQPQLLQRHMPAIQEEGSQNRAQRTT